MNRRNTNTAQAVHPIKVLFDRFQTDTLSHGHHSVETNREQCRELTDWFLTG